MFGYSASQEDEQAQGDALAGLMIQQARNLGHQHGAEQGDKCTTNFNRCSISLPNQEHSYQKAEEF